MSFRLPPPDETIRSHIGTWWDLSGDKPFRIAIRVALANDSDADLENRYPGYRAGVKRVQLYSRQLEGDGLDHVLFCLEADNSERAMAPYAAEVLNGRRAGFSTRHLNSSREPQLKRRDSLLVGK
jgi:hypothetical protein